MRRDIKGKWKKQKAPLLCTSSSQLCRIYIGTKENRVQRLVPKSTDEKNSEFLRPIQRFISFLKRKTFLICFVCGNFYLL
jgi:NADH dehydrogenase/NADH:ubiquinone oxidoreductase subunit G